jgi:hypothetical protein
VLAIFHQLKRREGLFGLTVAEVSVHGYLTLLFWACGVVSIAVVRTQDRRDCSPQSGWETKGDRKGKSPSPLHILLFSTGLHYLVSSNAIRLWRHPSINH